MLLQNKGVLHPHLLLVPCKCTLKLHATVTIIEMCVIPSIHVLGTTHETIHIAEEQVFHGCLQARIHDGSLLAGT